MSAQMICPSFSWESENAYQDNPQLAYDTLVMTSFSDHHTNDRAPKRWKRNDHGTITAAHHGSLPTLRHDQYTIAWICALHIELAAARAMLDNIHNLLPVYEDENAYILGSINRHNIVIACLPAEGYGTNNAATVMTNMKRSFPSLRVSLMVGIGGGVPIKHDIRLGDVVVGTRVMQYDLGKIVEEGKFQRTAIYRDPGHLLRTAVSVLRSKHELGSSQTLFILQERMKAYPDYNRPTLQDRLFQATYDHRLSFSSCDTCDHLKLIPRIRRDDVIIHYGAIASGNQVMKHGITRDNIARELDVICFEMEAAGLMDILPCLPIRGICDYSDSHKSKEWQRYAAATAAAYARELLEEIPSIARRHTNETSRIPESDPNQLTPQKRRQLLLGSLRFEQIDSRKLDIKAEHVRTCRWLLCHPSYEAWLNPANLVQHHGFLWICGKPGAGKSTIMKFAYMEHKSQRKSAITASFFFHARGQYLEKSITGMYRSLLLQLLEGYPELQTVLDNTELVPPRPEACPPLNVLKHLFRDAVFALGQYPFTCFVDALDECDEQQAVDMVQFFEDLAADSATQGIPFRICFSSRHYPYISIQWGIRLVLEDQPGHAEDLAIYISSRLRVQVEDREFSKQLQSQLLHKAAGVFMWVILVVDMLNKEFRRGGMALKKRLEQIPCELSELFKNILTRDKEDMEALLLCILWILYAKGPLQPQEFYHALWSGLSLKGLADDQIPDTTVLDTSDGLGRLNRYVVSASKGLAETTKSEQPTVQFIHESVRDFLLKDRGLQQLWPEFGFDCESPSHEILKQCCSLYIKHTSVCASVSSVSAKWRPWIPGFVHRSETLRQYPFLRYATRHILHHANAAAKLFSQDEFLSSFPASDWITASGVLKSDLYSTNASLLYILADKGCPELVRTRLKVDPQIYVPGETHKYPLFAALENRNWETAVALLNSTCLYKEADEITDQAGHTPLQWAMIHGPEVIQRLLINKGSDVNAGDKDGQTPLLRASMGGNKDIAKLLIDKGADVHVSDKDGQTPLLQASIGGNKDIAKLLIDKGADVHVSDKDGQTPLLQASIGSNKDIAKLLIDKGADVHVSDKDGQTPLLRSSMGGNKDIAKLLIDKGADVHISDNDGQTPLLRASVGGNKDIAKLLIDKGADVNISDKDGQTPLLQALMGGNKDIAKLLIDKGADVNISDKDGQTPLLRASTRLKYEEASFISDNGADVNFSDEDGQTPLLRASMGGNEEIVKLLIDKGADVHVSDNDGQTPLLRAVLGGNEEIAKLFIDKGADVNVSNNDGQTPLSYAIIYGYEEIARLLINKGASVNVSDKDGHTPLVYAVIYGFEEIARLLIDQGASVNVNDHDGQTPLFNAVIYGFEEIAELLIDKGASVNVNDNDGQTPLFNAVTDGSEDMARLLIDKGASVNVSDKDGHTPLVYAVRHGWEKIARLLISKGADDNEVNRDGC